MKLNWEFKYMLKEKRSWFKFFVGMMVGLLLCGLYFFFSKNTIFEEPFFTPETIKNLVSVLKVEEKVLPTEITVISVGDIFMHDTHINAGYDKTTKKYNFDSVFEATKKYFQEADVSTTWLGATYSPKGPYLGYPLFKSPVELIDTLQNIGLDVAFRTNHTMDFGVKGLNETSQILKEHNITQVAGYATQEESKEFYIYQKNNLRVAFLGYIYGMNGLPIPEPWMINLIDLEKIKADIIKAKTQADFVVVGLHYGTEYERFPNKWQKEVAQQVADFGADMIIASHPHVIQTVDSLTSADGRNVFVAYGLGNFYCGQRFKYTDAGVILRYVISKEGDTTRLKEVSYIPTWVAEYRESGKLKFQILPSKEYIQKYDDKQAAFLTQSNYQRLKQTYQETVEHINNPAINFVEFKN